MEQTLPVAVYPGANRKDRYWPNGGGVMQAKLTKLVLHSTETMGLPGYALGGTAPTLTIDPWTQRVWQHYRDVRVSAKALRDTGGFAENRDLVAQIEIIGYSDPVRRNTGRFLPLLKQDGIDFIGEVIAWFCEGGKGGHQVPARLTTKPWLPYPASYGNTKARMSLAEYDAFTGILGHLHVPGNTHGDPTINIDAVFAAVQKVLKPKPPAPPKPEVPDTEEIDVSKLPTLKRGDKGANVKRAQALILANGGKLPKFGMDADFGGETERAVVAFRKSKSLPAGKTWDTACWKKALGL